MEKRWPRMNESTKAAHANDYNLQTNNDALFRTFYSRYFLGRSAIQILH